MDENRLPGTIWEIIEDLKSNAEDRELLVALRNRGMFEMFKSGAYTRGAIAKEVGLSYRQVQTILRNQAEIEMYLAEREVNIGPRPGPLVPEKTYDEYEAERKLELQKELAAYREKLELERASRNSDDDPFGTVLALSPEMQAKIVELHRQRQADLPD